MNTLAAANFQGVRVMAAVFTGSGLLMILVALPLVKRRVPMNRWYGVRIPAAFESPERWYEVNEYGGRLLARWAGLLVAAGIAGWFVPPTDLLAYEGFGAAVALVAALAPLIQVLLWVRPAKRA